MTSLNALDDIIIIIIISVWNGSPVSTETLLSWRCRCIAFEGVPVCVWMRFACLISVLIFHLHRWGKGQPNAHGLFLTGIKRTDGLHQELRWVYRTLVKELICPSFDKHSGMSEKLPSTEQSLSFKEKNHHMKTCTRKLSICFWLMNTVIQRRDRKSVV